MGRVVSAALVAMFLLPGTAAASAVTFTQRVTIAFGHALRGVACPSATFCLAVGSGGAAVSSLHPAAGATAWTMEQIGGDQSLSAVACASPRLCVVLGTAGQVFSSTHPSGSDWRTVRLALRKHASLTAIACPSTHLCVVTDNRGSAFTSANPASGWHRTAVTRQALDGISCASARLCVATTHGRRVLVSTHPAGGARAWRSLRVLPGGSYGTNAFYAIACPSASLCLGGASDLFEASFVATHAPTSARAWTTQAVYSSPEPYTNLVRADVACGSPDTCAGFTVDQFGLSVLYVRGGAGTRWRSVVVPGSDTLTDLSDVACAKTLCVAVDRRGGAIVGS